MKWLVGLIALLGGLLLAYEISYPTYAHKYRVVLTFDVNGQVHTGQSIIEVRASARPKILPEAQDVFYSVKGGAVYVDLGNGRALLGLLVMGEPPLYRADAAIWAPDVFEGPVRRPPRINRFESIRMFKGERPIPDRIMPLVVELTDAHDPTSVQWIRPSKLHKDLRTEITLTEARIQLLVDADDAAATSKIKTKIPWIDDVEKLKLFPEMLNGEGIRIIGASTRDLLLRER
ncbi:MAG TPA: hypothetical protein VNZ50_17965 [Hyphomicrobiaceae bacterium]|nr:hypothetical protein [Hyphomicrobiaceae bacterium]